MIARTGRRNFSCALGLLLMIAAIGFGQVHTRTLREVLRADADSVVAMIPEMSSVHPGDTVACQVNESPMRTPLENAMTCGSLPGVLMSFSLLLRIHPSGG